VTETLQHYFCVHFAARWRFQGTITLYFGGGGTKFLTL
jgi:hypothetical protein